MSTKGIKLKIKRRKGNKAIKKLKEILPARDVSVPLTIPMVYISKRSYTEKPKNPGGLIAFKKTTTGLITGSSKNFGIWCNFISYKDKHQNHIDAEFLKKSLGFVPLPHGDTIVVCRKNRSFFLESCCGGIFETHPTLYQIFHPFSARGKSCQEKFTPTIEK